MNAAERWAYIADVLTRALDLPEAERTGFLHEVSREQPELRTEILALYRPSRPRRTRSITSTRSPRPCWTGRGSG
jgi:hypothetical protein